MSQETPNGAEVAGPISDSLSVRDPEDYNLSRRLRQLHNARERFNEVVRTKSEEAASEEITRGRYREVVVAALIEYLIEVEPLLRNTQVNDKREDLGLNYWKSEDVLDELRGDPPEFIGDVEKLTLEEIVTSGGYLLDDLDEDGPDPLRIDQSRAAFRLANRFLGEVGFGLELDEGLPIEREFDQTREDEEVES